MRFTLSPDLTTLREDAYKAFLAAIPPDPPQAGDLDTALAAPARGAEFPDELLPMVHDLWERPPEEGDDRLLRAVLTCEAAGMAASAFDVGQRFLLGWIASRLPRWGTLLREQPHLSSLSSTDAATRGELRRAGAHYQLHGRCRMLWPTGSEATRVLLFAQHHGRVALVSAHLTGPRVRHFSRDTVQRGCRLVWAEFDFAEITRTDVVPLNEATFSAHDLTCLGRVLTAAEILGAMQWALDASVRRARERKQFDQPIGGFQAVAHRCADMLCAVELCRSIVYAAAASQDGRGTPDTDLSSFARLLLWQESLPVLTTALQLFGADGLRWSSDLHLQLRRGQVLRQLWETPCGVADEMTGYLAASVQASGRQQRRA